MKKNESWFLIGHFYWIKCERFKRVVVCFKSIFQKTWINHNQTCILVLLWSITLHPKEFPQLHRHLSHCEAQKVLPTQINVLVRNKYKLLQNMDLIFFSPHKDSILIKSVHNVSTLRLQHHGYSFRLKVQFNKHCVKLSEVLNKQNGSTFLGEKKKILVYSGQLYSLK